MLCCQQDVKMMCSADLEQDVIPLLVRLQTARRLVPWLLEALVHLHPHIHRYFSRAEYYQRRCDLQAFINALSTQQMITGHVPLQAAIPPRELIAWPGINAHDVVNGFVDLALGNN